MRLHVLVLRLGVYHCDSFAGWWFPLLTYNSGCGLAGQPGAQPNMKCDARGISTPYWFCNRLVKASGYWSLSCNARLIEPKTLSTTFIRLKMLMAGLFVYSNCLDGWFIDKKKLHSDSMLSNNIPATLVLFSANQAWTPGTWYWTEAPVWTHQLYCLSKDLHWIDRPSVWAKFSCRSKLSM